MLFRPSCPIQCGRTEAFVAHHHIRTSLHEASNLVKMPAEGGLMQTPGRPLRQLQGLLERVAHMHWFTMRN